jgi:hypothetical protein
MASRYPEVYAAWQRDPQAFWAEAAQEIDWIEKPKTIFDPNAGVYGRWFPDAVCNTCWNAVDRHVQGGRAAQPALIYDSPMAGAKRVYTYAQLLEEVRTLAGVLQEFGVAKGDRVVIYMPMVPEALFAMLACARIGAIHSVVFGGSGDETCSIGEIVGKGFSSDGVIDAVETIVDTYLKLRESPGEDFLAAYRRVGEAPFQEALYAHAA